MIFQCVLRLDNNLLEFVGLAYSNSGELKCMEPSERNMFQVLGISSLLQCSTAHLAAEGAV